MPRRPGKLVGRQGDRRRPEPRYFVDAHSAVLSLRNLRILHLPRLQEEGQTTTCCLKSIRSATCPSCRRRQPATTSTRARHTTSATPAALNDSAPILSNS